MGFQYLTGLTTAGAPDEVLNWFATFQNWVTSALEWEVVSGEGTNNLVITSKGEGGEYDQLFLHIWESAPGSVRAEVQNDGAGTQTTDEGGILLSGGAQFTYFMAANQEAIAIIFRTGIPNWTCMYVGCVMPFAMNPPDETYTMIATDDTLNACSVLRDYDNTWDVDIVLTDNAVADNFEVCPLNNTFPPTGILAGAAGGIVGQLYHLSGEVGQTAVSGLLLLDTITTLANAYDTTTWIVLRGSTPLWFCMRTGGALPTGLADSTGYSYETGITSDYTDFIENRISPFLVNLGWVDLGDPGLHDVGRLFYSTGESREDDIFIIVAYSLPAVSYFANYVQDDAAGGNRTPNSVTFPVDQLAFPTRYHLAGDRDCLLWTLEVGQYLNYPNWLGKAVPGDPEAPSTAYSVLCASFSGTSLRLLRDHTGAWTPATGFFYLDVVTNTSPNLFDGITNVLWPVGGLATGAGGGVRRDYQGTLKYLYQVHGFTCCPGDTIAVADRRYTVLSAGAAGAAWAVRTL